MSVCAHALCVNGAHNFHCTRKFASFLFMFRYNLAFYSHLAATKLKGKTVICNCAWCRQNINSDFKTSRWLLTALDNFEIVLDVDFGIEKV